MRWSRSSSAVDGVGLSVAFPGDIHQRLRRDSGEQTERYEVRSKPGLGFRGRDKFGVLVFLRGLVKRGRVVNGPWTFFYGAIADGPTT